MENEYLINKIEKYADEKGIPIMEKDGINFLTEFIKLNNIKNILEVGTAIGYSAIKMALVSEDVTITTIERDKDRYLDAIKNIKEFNLENRITPILGDALDYKPEEEFDMIFIDAAKSQYTKFFERFTKNLSNKGFVITDNINFHGLVSTDKSKLSRNVRQLVTKLEKYVDFLKDNKDFKTRFFEVGDGIAISRRKKENE